VEVAGGVAVVDAVDVFCGALDVEPVPVEVLVVPAGVLAVLDVVDELAGEVLDELPEEPQPASAIAIAAVAVRSAGTVCRTGLIERGTVATVDRHCATAGGERQPNAASSVRSAAVVVMRARSATAICVMRP
jgi:hypothetical protein